MKNILVADVNVLRDWLVPQALFTLLVGWHANPHGSFCLMRLHHSPDASPFPGFELTCFVYIKYYFENNQCTCFKLGYVQPFSIMFYI